VIEAKKKFGQNFLQDTTIKQKIIQSMPKNNRNLVEIGPGLGDLTQKLLEVKPLVAYEVDSDLCVYLRNKFSKEIESGRLSLIEGDVLDKFERGGFLSDKEYDLVANLPYYIATTIILKALKDPLCKSMVVMIQKEVAQKFSAACMSKEFTSLAILAQSIGNARILFDVPPEAFEPQPKVVSSVLFIEKSTEYIKCERDGLFEDAKELQSFEKYLKSSFRAPRKTWLKNISSDFSKEKANSLLLELGYKISIRPHELSVSTHHLLFNKLKKQGEIDGREKRGNE
jgi:16S rRNA (adenine1518-N6/adenine1519-N6)-dimethyltransferase